MSDWGTILLRYTMGRLTIAMLLLVFSMKLHAQDNYRPSQFSIKNNVIYLTLPKKLSPASLDSFADKHNLNNIGLYQLVFTGQDDSLKKNGWIIKPEQFRYIISKALAASKRITDPGSKIIFSAVPTPENWRKVGGNKVVYGANVFDKYESIRQESDIVFFYLRGYGDAKQVRLAGNFTNWQHAAFPMTKTADGWLVKVQLKPGPYYYKFIINEWGWITDPANKLRENDGQGNINSVMFVNNKTFFLKGYETAREVYLSGSFNNWNKESLRMKSTTGGWRLDMYLAEGTHEYEFVVDGKIIRDDKDDTAAIGTAHRFVLKGFPNAKKVTVAGNFNDWKQDQLYMKRTATGWQLPYVLGPGNYQYKFIVDGKWITDPDNKAIVDDGTGNENSFMVIGGNYTFRLKAISGARNVFLAGDFNNWSPRGLPMTQTENGWECKVYLGRGKHLYKFLVDGKWILDPANKLWEENELGTGNSVLWID